MINYLPMCYKKNPFSYTQTFLSVVKPNCNVRTAKLKTYKSSVPAFQRRLFPFSHELFKNFFVTKYYILCYLVLFVYLY